MPMTTSSQLNKDVRTAEGRPQLEHRHFAVIADIIQRRFRKGHERDEVAWIFAHEFGTTNPKFSRSRFLLACGVRDE